MSRSAEQKLRVGLTRVRELKYQIVSPHNTEVGVMEKQRVLARIATAIAKGDESEADELMAGYAREYLQMETLKNWAEVMADAYEARLQ
jgi:hypothetical protein